MDKITTRLYEISTLLYIYKKQLKNQYDMSDIALTEAKKLNLKNFELNQFYTNYRNDQFLKDCYISLINPFNHFISNNINKQTRYNDILIDTILVHISLIIDTHTNAIQNANYHLSDDGFCLIKSFDLTLLFQLKESLE
jgi:hypothetical protein